VHYLAAERVDEADAPVHVGAHERVRLVVAFEEFVDDDALVDEVDAEVAAAQRAAFVLKLVGRADDRPHAARGEVVADEDELVLGREPRPVHDGDVRALGPAPLGVGLEQRAEESAQRVGLRQAVALGDAPESPHLEEHLVEFGLVGEARRILGVVLDEPDFVAVDEGVEPRRHGGALEAGVDERESALPVGQPHAVEERVV
jgi:hypothetical protein